MRTKGSLLVVTAPSGAGKTTVLSRLRELQPELCFSVSATTREPREGERDGVDYHFLDRASFEQRIAASEFLEHAEVHGRLYGTLRTETEDRLTDGLDVLLDIDVQGAAQVRETGFPARFVFLLPPSREELERRLRGRGTETEEVVLRRLQAARSEMEEATRFDDLVVNDDVETAARAMQAIVLARRSTREAQEERLHSVLASFRDET
ncbi:MAG: guanylate kinase [Acidobacteriota bacterium]